VIGNQVRGWGEGGEGLKNLFFTPSRACDSRFGIGVPSGRSLRCLFWIGISGLSMLFGFFTVVTAAMFP